MLTPLVVIYDGQVIYSCLVNEKAYSKSLERKELWSVRQDTHKVLLVRPRIIITSIRKEREWYVAQARNNPYVSLEDEDMNSVISLKNREKSKTKYTHKLEGLEFLQALYDVILQKKAESDRDSYTGYLFESGSDKIKKKLGEEAIEVVLARTKKDICNESADLLYHLLVFFVQNDILLTDCIKILEQRHISC